ncbi:MAG TPA: flagellin, partial [Gemmatimonadaceae bacterium]|nr:flagellin [Gemmatimonadaceae bacterium]
CTYGSKVNNGGAVNNAASTINGSGNIGSVVVSNAGTLQTVQGNITGAVSKVGNTIGTGVTGVAGSVVAVSNQATADTLTTAPVLFSSTFNTSTAVSTGGTYVVDGTDVSAIAFDNTASGSGSLIAGATYHFTAVANGGSNVDVKLLDSSNAQVGTTQTIAAGATTVAVNGVTLTLSGSLTQAQDITALNTKDFKVTQNYTVGLTGGGKVLQTASLADNGTSQSMAFTTYGITVQASTNTAALFQGKSLGVTEADKLTLSGTDTSGNALTQSININASAASQAMGFTTFGLTVNLSATATVSGLKTDVNGGLNSIVQSGTRTAQYLVSSSQSYSTNDLVSLSTVDLTAATLGVTTTAVNLSTAAGAQAALATIDTAIGTVGTAIGAIGAAENRITYANANVKTAIENFTAANSVIKDVDMASEMTMFTKNQILSQAGTAMLAQANQLGAGVLQLLK